MADRSPAEMRERLEKARAEALEIQMRENARRSPQQMRDQHQDRRGGK